MITVNADEANCRDDEPAPELRTISSPAAGPDPLQMHPELAGAILYDPTEPASEDEWPA